MASTSLDLGEIAGGLAASIPDGSVLIVVGGKIVALHPGTNGQQLEADSTNANGVKWDTAS